jgi:hypothetical protein
MLPENQRVMPSHPRRTSFPWLRIGMTLIVLGLLSIVLGRDLYFGLYIHTPIHVQGSCADSRHCLVTIHNAGGGFDHGFNPAFQWAITGDRAASLQFSPASGTLQVNQSVQVQLAIASGSCPNTITITSKTDIMIFSPFAYDAQTNQCSLAAPFEA